MPDDPACLRRVCPRLSVYLSVAGTLAPQTHTASNTYDASTPPPICCVAVYPHTRTPRAADPLPHPWYRPIHQHTQANSPSSITQTPNPTANGTADYPTMVWYLRCRSLYTSSDTPPIASNTTPMITPTHTDDFRQSHVRFDAEKDTDRHTDTQTPEGVRCSGEGYAPMSQPIEDPQGAQSSPCLQ